MMTKPFLPSALAGGTALALTLVLAAPAGAQTLEDLQAENRALAAELQRLAEKIEKLEAKTTENQKAMMEESPVEFDPKKRKVKSRDGDFEFQVGGRIQADVAFYDDDITDLGSGAELRRARLFMQGKLYKDWKFKNQIDFADNGVSVKDAYIQYTALKPVKITVGNHKEPFSLEELTSSKYATFMERALPNAFTPGRALGLSGETDDSGFGVTGRLTLAPWAEKTRAVHLGLAGSYRSNVDGGTVRFRARPESHVTDVRFVDTGSMTGVDDFSRIGPELAVVYDSLSVQGEYMLTSVSRSMNASGSSFADPTFNGWYVYASWFPFGGSRNYDPKKGTFGRTKATDALELALRYSTIDLTDEEARGGEEDNFTVGLNYYFNPHVRWMLNYVHADVDLDGGADDEDANVFQSRLAIDF
jgi:phosphate-selective porin OprO/OprP